MIKVEILWRVSKSLNIKEDRNQFLTDLGISSSSPFLHVTGAEVQQADKPLTVYEALSWTKDAEIAINFLRQQCKNHIC